MSDEGLVAIKDEGNDESEQPDEIKPHIPFKMASTSKEKPLVYFDENESAFILNSSWTEGIKMFHNPKSDGALNEILRAIVKTTPENQYLSTDDLDKKYYNLVDNMSGKE